MVTKVGGQILATKFGFVPEWTLIAAYIIVCIESHCFYVYVYQRCPQTLVAKCSNLGIHDVFKTALIDQSHRYGRHQAACREAAGS